MPHTMRFLGSTLWAGRRLRLCFPHCRLWRTYRTAARPPCVNSQHYACVWRGRATRRATTLSGIDALSDSLARSAVASRALVRRFTMLTQLTKTMFDAMAFGFLFNPTRKLFSIGYRVADNSLDPSCYDLLASEARLTSFIAIAKGDVPSSHWFHLGRALTPVDWGSALVSWSGSMFEYLMPALVMRSPPGSLLDQTSHLIVRRQQKYGTERGVPWGISESAYNARDLELTYQYANFGESVFSSGNIDLGVTSGSDGVDRCGNLLNVQTQHRPSGSAENDNGDLPARKILLVADILVCGQ